MSRTFPRATGVTPANWVSRTTFMAGAGDTERFPRLSATHSSALHCQLQAVRRWISLQILLRSEARRRKFAKGIGKADRVEEKRKLRRPNSAVLFVPNGLQRKAKTKKGKGRSPLRPPKPPRASSSPVPALRRLPTAR